MALLPWANLIHQGLSQFKALAANFCNSAMLLEGSTETSFSSPIRLMRRISKGSPFSSTLDSRPHLPPLAEPGLLQQAWHA